MSVRFFSPENRFTVGESGTPVSRLNRSSGSRVPITEWMPCRKLRLACVRSRVSSPSRTGLSYHAGRTVPVGAKRMSRALVAVRPRGGVTRTRAHVAASCPWMADSSNQGWQNCPAVKSSLKTTCVSSSPGDRCGSKDAGSSGRGASQCVSDCPSHRWDPPTDCTLFGA